MTELQEKAGKGKGWSISEQHRESEGGFRYRENMGLGMQRHPRHFPGLLQQLPHQSCLPRTAKEGLLEAKSAQVSTAQR